MKTDIKLRSYCEINFGPVGFVKIRVMDGNSTKILNMYVVNYNREPLLGREWINLEVLKNLKNSLNQVQTLNWIESSDKNVVENLMCV